MTVPVSVIVPHLLAREAFFRRFTLPSIAANEPLEILIEDGAEGACRARNRGADRAKQPFFFFCDDDLVLAEDALVKLASAIEGKGDVGVAYGNYLGCATTEAAHPNGHCFLHVAPPWDRDSLRRQNYVACASLWRASTFPGFDCGLAKFHDWDCALALDARGLRGERVPELVFLAFWFDRTGISLTADDAAAREAIRAKWKPVWKGPA